MLFGWKKDVLAGTLIAGIGAFAVVVSQNYRMGDLARVGPGVFPTAIGVLMIFMGVLLAINARESDEPTDATPDGTGHGTDWRGRGCVIAGPVLFVALGQWFGLAPATFACVFVSALGDRGATLRGAALLAVTISVFGIALFVYVLQVPFPVLRWPGA